VLSGLLNSQSALDLCALQCLLWFIGGFRVGFTPGTGSPFLVCFKLGVALHCGQFGGRVAAGSELGVQPVAVTGVRFSGKTGDCGRGVYPAGGTGSSQTSVPGATGGHWVTLGFGQGQRVG
jgi:hypothetical protein